MISTNWLRPKYLPENLSLLKASQTFLDLLVLSSAFITAYMLRFEFSLTTEQASTAFLQMLFVAPFQLLVLRICK